MLTGLIGMPDFYFRVMTIKDYTLVEINFLRSDDQGSTWKEISPDLTRGVPQEMQKLMDQSWSIDQLVRKGSMAQIVSIAESPIDEKILFVGSGDGLNSLHNERRNKLDKIFGLRFA